MDWVEGTCRDCAREGRVTPLRWVPNRRIFLCDDHLYRCLLVAKVRMKHTRESAFSADHEVEGNEKTEAPQA